MWSNPMLMLLVQQLLGRNSEKWRPLENPNNLHLTFPEIEVIIGYTENNFSRILYSKFDNPNILNN